MGSWVIRGKGYTDGQEKDTWVDGVPQEGIATSRTDNPADGADDSKTEQRQAFMNTLVGVLTRGGVERKRESRR